MKSKGGYISEIIFYSISKKKFKISVSQGLGILYKLANSNFVIFMKIEGYWKDLKTLWDVATFTNSIEFTWNI